MSIDQQPRDRVEVVASVITQTYDEIEAPLADPDLRLLFADQADAHRSHDVSRRQSDSGCGVAIDGNLQLRQTGQLLRSQTDDALDAPYQLPCRFRQPGLPV